MDLQGKVVIVTGSSRGIGKATALELARARARVVVAARTEVSTIVSRGTIHETVAEITATGGEAMAVAADVASLTDVNNMVQQTLTRWGRIDVLVNNAGLIGGNVPFIDTTLSQWVDIIGSNLFGAFICSQAVAHHMVQQGEGAIINITSGAAVRAGFLNVPYGVAKAGIDRLTLGIGAELTEKGVACVSVSPPVTDTETVRREYPDQDFSSWSYPPEMTARAIRLLLENDPLQHSGTMVPVRRYLEEREGVQ